LICLACRPAFIAIATVLVPALPADAQNEALLRLLQVLRDRGSITAQEYEEIKTDRRMSSAASLTRSGLPAASSSRLV
jgi:hypothetical protein